MCRDTRIFDDSSPLPDPLPQGEGEKNAFILSPRGRELERGLNFRIFNMTDDFLSPDTMTEQYVHWFRNSAPYINAHRGKTFVLMFGGEAVNHDNFRNIIHDIWFLVFSDECLNL